MKHVEVIRQDIGNEQGEEMNKVRKHAIQKEKWMKRGCQTLSPTTAGLTTARPDVGCLNLRHLPDHLPTLRRLGYLVAPVCGHRSRRSDTESVADPSLHGPSCVQCDTMLGRVRISRRKGEHRIRGRCSMRQV